MKTQDAKKSRQKSPSGHHRSTLSGYVFGTNELRPTSGWDRFTSLGHPGKFQRVSRLVTARHLVVGVSQTLRRWTEGATYVWQGDHHVGHWPTFLVLLLSCAIFIVWQMEKRVGCLPSVPPLKPTRAAYAQTYAKTEPVRRRLTTTSLQYCNLTPYEFCIYLGYFAHGLNKTA